MATLMGASEATGTSMVIPMEDMEDMARDPQTLARTTLLTPLNRTEE